MYLITHNTTLRERERERVDVMVVMLYMHCSLAKQSLGRRKHLTREEARNACNFGGLPF